MAIQPAKCPHCGRALMVDDLKDADKCRYCGEAFITDKAIASYNYENTNASVQAINTDQIDEDKINETTADTIIDASDNQHTDKKVGLTNTVGKSAIKNEYEGKRFSELSNAEREVLRREFIQRYNSVNRLFLIFSIVCALCGIALCAYTIIAKISVAVFIIGIIVVAIGIFAFVIYIQNYKDNKSATFHTWLEKSKKIIAD